MHKVSANYTMPTILNSLKPAAASGLLRASTAKTGSASATGAASTTSSTSSSTSGSGLDTTFLNLLAQELQNQDPTAPVDSTAMVGQMISLNQLDQLISINQSITGSSSSTSGSSQSAGTAANASALSMANSGVASILSPSAAGAATSQLPFNPTTMMPLGYGNAGAVAASINPSLNSAGGM
jgi:flagellar basal-body rod modification protein FlgD